MTVRVNSPDEALLGAQDSQNRASNLSKHNSQTQTVLGYEIPVDYPSDIPKATPKPTPAKPKPKPKPKSIEQEVTDYGYPPLEESPDVQTPPKPLDEYKPVNIGPPNSPDIDHAWIDSASTLEELNQGIISCQNCLLGKGKTPAYRGHGPKGAPIFFVLEPPIQGTDPDSPYSVSADQWVLFQNIVSKGLKLRMEDIYFTPICKCPVQDDFRPQLFPLKVCSHIIYKEIELVKPRVVLTMGPSSSETMGASKPTSLYLLRQRKLNVSGTDIPLRMTFGLATMVEDPIIKRECWDDLKAVKKILLPS
jgi:DNA polymerase